MTAEAAVGINGLVRTGVLRAACVLSTEEGETTMNKEDLVNAMATLAGLTKRQAGDALDAFTSTVVSTLKAGGKVSLVGFGTWATAVRAERDGRNPQTGAKIKIKQATVPKFVAGKQLKDEVNV